MTIVIHPGLKKCGSSSIHAFFRVNRDALSRANIDYPGPGRPGTDLANELQKRRRFHSAFGTLSRLVEHRAANPNRLLVLSSEMLEETETDQAVQIRDGFSAFRRAEQFVIVFVIRQLVQLIPSIYAQKVREGRFLDSFDSFFESIITERRVHYFDTVSRWARAFGWDRIRVRMLDPKQLKNGDLIDDFISLLGTDIDILPPQIRRPGISNSAPGWRVIEALRAVHSGKHGLKRDHPIARRILKPDGVRTLSRAAWALGNENGWNRDRGNYLTLHQSNACVDTLASNIAKLNDHLVHDKILMPTDSEPAGCRGRAFLPDWPRIPSDELTMFYNQLGAAISKVPPAAKRRSRAHAQTNK